MYIINGDDFGLSENVNIAIAKCFQEGLINRTTILVNMPAAQAACDMARELGFLDAVGLHINLVEGPAMSELCRKNTFLCDENGCFRGEFYKNIRYRFFVDKDCHKAIEAEIEAQIQKYLEMGFTLMHADSHRYLHTYPTVARAAEPLLKKYGFCSLRISRNLMGNDTGLFFRVYKFFYNRHVRSLAGMKTSQYFGSMDDFLLAPKDEDTEIMVHPVMRDGVLMDDTLPSPKPFFGKDFLEKQGITLEPQRRKRTLLIVFPKNHIGGSMTALMNFLQTIDPQCYEVDLVMREFAKNMPQFPEHVNLLEPAKYAWTWKNVLRLLPGLVNPLYYVAKLIVMLRDHYGMSETLSSQIIMRNNILFNRRLKKQYDVAMAYELNWCLYYLVKRVKAQKKILLVHNDYHTIGYKFLLDRSFFRHMDTVAFVSDACMEKFLKKHPEYREKSWFLPNITASKTIVERSKLPIEQELPEMTGKLRLLSISRVSFDAKGIDRIIPVCLRLRHDGLLDRLSWVILGGGDDLNRLHRMIEENNLGSNVFAVGKTNNPMPWLKHFDAMMLPSRTEGKPMAVTEAQILGVPPVVTRYTSAATQIENGVDGLIFENDDEALYQGIKDLVIHPEKLAALRDTVCSRRYSNEEDIDYFYRMVDALF